ncbi:DUF6328 family protein [Streptomyces racemochromogenes]|uniref:DUF6328 family protein n=1 Tax=Streptomyces racemochromogenes TaxID=67353 RepID=A0ABW7PEA2_9ACTN
MSNRLLLRTHQRARLLGPGDRHESCDERADRLWGELLHEVRVALTAVQLLLAFLLAAPFTQVFGHLPVTDHLLYVVCVVLGGAATGALTAPVCLHRLVTGLGVKPEAVVWAARLTLTGLVLLLGMVALALLIVLRTVLGAPTALVVDLTVVVWCASCWLVPTVLVRRTAVLRRGATVLDAER